MKIKWITEDRDSSLYGKMLKDHEYTVDTTEGKQLVSQGFAVEVKPAPKPKAPEIKKK